jgi:hypothetical protein
MRYRSPRHRAAPPIPASPSAPSPDGVPDVVPIRIASPAETAALDQRAA